MAEDSDFLKEAIHELLMGCSMRSFEVGSLGRFGQLGQSCRGQQSRQFLARVGVRRVLDFDWPMSPS